MASLIQFYNPVIDQWLSGAHSMQNCKAELLSEHLGNNSVPAELFPPTSASAQCCCQIQIRDHDGMFKWIPQTFAIVYKMRNISKWIDASDFRMEMNQKKISPDCHWLVCWWSLNNKIWWDRYRVSYDYNVGHIWIQWGHLTEHQHVRGNLINSGSTLIETKYLHSTGNKAHKQTMHISRVIRSLY